MSGLLITRPNHDLPTNYLFYFSEEIISQAKKNRIAVADLKKNRANKKELVRIVKKIKPEIIVFNGHGNEEIISGYNNEVLIKINRDEELLKRSIIYAVSCRSAKKLGPSCIKSGTLTYLGYTEDFIFLYDENVVTRPKNDKIASFFLKPSNQVAISLLKKNTAGQSSLRSKELFRKTIRRLLTSEAAGKEKEALPYLLWDLNHQVCLGDSKAKI